MSEVAAIRSAQLLQAAGAVLPARSSTPFGRELVLELPAGLPGYFADKIATVQVGGRLFVADAESGSRAWRAMRDRLLAVTVWCGATAVLPPLTAP